MKDSTCLAFHTDSTFLDARRLDFFLKGLLKKNRNTSCSAYARFHSKTADNPFVYRGWGFNGARIGRFHKVFADDVDREFARTEYVLPRVFWSFGGE